jgi:hypothetical protein
MQNAVGQAYALYTLAEIADAVAYGLRPIGDTRALRE